MSELCEKFRALEERILLLKNKFLEDQLISEREDIANFTADLDRIAAFRLLAHAEIEEFLETKAREGLGLMQKTVRERVALRNHGFAILHLAAQLNKPIKLSYPFEEAKFREEAANLLREALNAIDDNNGIKGASFFNLSIFSGKLADEIDEALASSLTSYGKSRGDVAHRSAARVRTILAPSVEASMVETIIAGLRTYYYGNSEIPQPS